MSEPGKIDPEERAQLERIHPEALDADSPGTAASPAQGRARPVSVM